MTDLEISKALALAIGWKHEQMRVVGVCYPDLVLQESEWNTARVFDYYEWSVIGPIAVRYNCFPIRVKSHLWLYKNVTADTPQKVIALVVIGAKK